LTNGSADTGGGIWNIDASLSLSRVVVTKNVAVSAGGGIVVSGGSLTLADSTVSDNVGTGVFVMPSASASITGSTVSGDTTAGSGGGVFVDAGASLSVTDSTVTGNAAPRSNGGRLFLSSAVTAVIRNSTIAYNSALFVGGMFTYTDLASLESTIVAKNIGASAPDPNGSIRAPSSLIGNTAGMPLKPASANNLLNRDPLLGPLADNGGPTRTHALLPGSPAVNAGSNRASLSYDQRGSGFGRVVG